MFILDKKPTYFEKGKSKISGAAVETTAAPLTNY
ncbi:hypothetical protein EFD32_0683 [Enterococcus faecalis D32]|nr:hypothetical protein EFD32_0683 [Enterococcus faecalis D32]